MAGIRDLDQLLLDGNGFPGCQRCKYFQTGSAALCYRCASKEWQRLAGDGDRCQICDLPFNAGEQECRNPVCKMSDRWFEWNYAVAMRTGALENTISAYKYYAQKHWAIIFGRLLVGFLEANDRLFRSMDALIASPSFTGEGAHRTWGHIDLIVQAAAKEGPMWPFDLTDPSVIVKTTETEQMARRSYQERKKNAQTSLRAALAVPDRSRTQGKRIVVVDDVFTDGLTLNEVARALRQAGAAQVFGVTLARQPFRGIPAGTGPGEGH